MNIITSNSFLLVFKVILYSLSIVFVIGQNINENNTEEILIRRQGSLLHTLGRNSSPEYKVIDESENENTENKNIFTESKNTTYFANDVRESGQESSFIKQNVTQPSNTKTSVISKITKNFGLSKEIGKEISSAEWDNSDLSTRNFSTNFTSLSSLLDVFDSNRLGDVWSTVSDFTNISNECIEDMGLYLHELRKGTPWALKMDDASGRYTTGFFWGNNFWMGSASLCSNIDGPIPFKQGFFMTRIRISIPKQIYENSRDIHLGLCLPYSCTKKDLQQILELSSSSFKNESTHLEILAIRSQHTFYVFWKDITFWILLGVSSFVMFLILIGTIYDLYLNPVTSDLSDVIPTEKHVKKNLLGKSGHLSAEMTPTTNNNNIINNAIRERNNGHVCNLNDSREMELQASTNSKKSHPSHLGLISRMVLAFSAKTNLLTICSKTVGDNTIPVLHGLRVISMTWVILGHVCIVALKYSDNTEFRELAEKQVLFQTISQGAFSVDTFFFISGCLVSFLYFRTVTSLNMEMLTMSTGITSRVVEFFGLLGYRFLRLTVPYMFVLGVVEVTMKWFNYNSVFEPPALDHENCPKYWWRNALYINTLFPNKEMCMLWSWYLANDTQFFILGSILLIVAVRHFRLAGILGLIFLVSSWLTTGFLAYTNKHMPNLDDPLALFDQIYDKPWTRLGPYFIGMAVGWLLYKTDCKINMHKVVVILGWVISASCLLLLIYGLHNAELHPLTAAAYSSLSHSAWALGLSWLVIACTTGHGGYITHLLSLPILHPFSRVTYCAYLVHPLMIRVVVMTTDSPIHMSVGTLAIRFFGQTMISYILSFIVSLMFEAPVVSLLKVMSVEVKKRIQ